MTFGKTRRSAVAVLFPRWENVIISMAVAGCWKEANKESYNQLPDTYPLVKHSLWKMYHL